MHSAIHRPIPPSPLFLASFASVFSASRIATIKLPKQIEPKEYVVALTKLSRTPFEQHDDASSGATHQVPTVPATGNVWINVNLAQVYAK